MARRRRLATCALALTIGLAISACGSSQDVEKSASDPNDGWWRIAGTCDASAIAPISKSNDFVFANDENDVLRRWSAPKPYPPPSGATAGEVTPWLDLSSKVDSSGGIDGKGELTKKREMDLEGAAQIGEQVFWIGSHGLNKSGKYRPNRMIFLATNVPTATNSGDLSGKARNLLPTLRNTAGIKDKLKFIPPLPASLEPGEPSGTAPKEGGLNIEGLATDGKGLLIGLRSPVTDGKAWILRLANPAAIVADVDTKPEITVHARLDLGEDRGIRAMTESSNGWLIVGGALNDPPPNFGLFEWDGAQGTQKLKSIDYTFTDGTRPEGIAYQGENALIVSDDGSVKRPVTECKSQESDDKFFRATLVSASRLTPGPKRKQREESSTRPIASASPTSSPTKTPETKTSETKTPETKTSETKTPEINTPAVEKSASASGATRSTDNTGRAGMPASSGP